MVTRTCDKCGRIMKAPNAFSPFFGCTDNDTIERASLIISRKVSETELVPVDLCNECEMKVYEFIFNKEKCLI